MPSFWHYNWRRLWETTHFIYFRVNTKKLLTCHRFRTIMGAPAPKNLYETKLLKTHTFFRADDP